MSTMSPEGEPMATTMDHGFTVLQLSKLASLGLVFRAMGTGNVDGQLGSTMEFGFSPNTPLNRAKLQGATSQLGFDIFCQCVDDARDLTLEAFMAKYPSLAPYKQG